MGGMFKFVVFLVFCAGLLVLFGEDVLKSEYVQKRFYPNDYWPPKVQGFKDKEIALRDLIYKTELDIEEAKLLGKYAVIEIGNKAKANGLDEATAMATEQEKQDIKVTTLINQLKIHRKNLESTIALIKFASQYKSEKTEY